MSHPLIDGALGEVEDDLVDTAVSVSVVSGNRNVLLEIDDENDEDDLVVGALNDDTVNSSVNVQEASIPEDVQLFLLNLSDSLSDNDLERLTNLYDKSFAHITYRYYLKTKWPSIKSVEAFYEQHGLNNHILILLYSELYYRHIFSKFPNSIKWQDRVDSWYNYLNILVYILLFMTNKNSLDFMDQLPKELKEALNKANTNDCSHVNLMLPNEWLYGIFDELIYQLQDTWRYRYKIATSLYMNKSNQSDYSHLYNDKSIWGVDIVLQLLQTIFDLSKNQTFIPNEDTNNENMLKTEYDIYISQLSLFSLIRLHVLIGDYYTAVDLSNNIEISIIRKVLNTFISYIYYLGYSYMMLQRYIDAIRVFQQSSVSISATKLSYQNDSLSKTIDKISLLILFCQLLSNGVNSPITSKYDDNIYGDRKNPSNSLTDSKNWTSLLIKISPKFIGCSLPSFKNNEDLTDMDLLEPQKRQLYGFSLSMNLYDINNMIKSFTKLYNNLNIDTLSNLIQVEKFNKNPIQGRNNHFNSNNFSINDSNNSNNSSNSNINSDINYKDIARSNIMAIKNKFTRQKIWRPTYSLLDGDFVPISTDFDIYLLGDTIHMTEGKQTDKFVGDTFTKHILKTLTLQSIVNSLVPKTKSI